MSYQNLSNKIFEVKEKLSDGEYKYMMDQLGKFKKNDKIDVIVYGVKIEEFFNYENEQYERTQNLELIEREIRVTQKQLKEIEHHIKVQHTYAYQRPKILEQTYPTTYSNQFDLFETKIKIYKQCSMAYNNGMCNDEEKCSLCGEEAMNLDIDLSSKKYVIWTRVEKI